MKVTTIPCVLLVCILAVHLTSAAKDDEDDDPQCGSAGGRCVNKGRKCPDGRLDGKCSSGEVCCKRGGQPVLRKNVLEVSETNKTFCKTHCERTGGYCMSKKKEKKLPCEYTPKVYSTQLTFCIGKPCICCQPPAEPPVVPSTVPPFTMPPCIRTSYCQRKGGECIMPGVICSGKTYGNCSGDGGCQCCVADPCENKEKRRCLKGSGKCKGVCSLGENTILNGCKGKSSCVCCTEKDICEDRERRRCIRNNGECKATCLPSERQIPNGCKKGGCVCCAP